jgi:hypothetical protein
LVVGCDGGGATSTTVSLGAGAESPAAAVEDLRSLLSSGDFAAAASLAVPEQAALAALAEGATAAEVAAALEEGDTAIAANFWEGFAQGAGDAFAGDADITDQGSTTRDGVEFHLVGMRPQGGEDQIIITRDVDGQRIDLFATFGAGLAQGLMSPVEVLLSSPNADARVVLAALRDVVPSLFVAAEDESLSPEAVQGILQLVELITRVG